ncbi:ACP S-malonyltransferase [Liquorilactobacillus vini]|uniref:Malonyl CoA-acyl carrier protein transacylase n=1 Tax=Liquorilactobacillus vini DSM 20605 TaxID=1133569 RepID=A0A0R2CBC7_9LACO|nr:ACP S-malonyltransferase [Liquorilactobacillus vini]KRM88887.1 malonyl-CoA-[acyl-carrier-protein] transacylase [Liquorilactobacillus vini DSM 20605]
MKVGILFSGQGAQFSNMGLDFYQNSKAYQETLKRLSGYLQKDLVAFCKNQHNELLQTKNVQTAITAFGLGVFHQLQQDLPTIETVAMLGLSLGEYTALMAAGAFDEKTGIRLLQARADYMQADAEQTDGSMVAVLRADVQKVAKICQQVTGEVKHFVGIANYNTEQQVVIGGQSEAVQRAITTMKDQGIKKVISLKVSGAFHTPLFKNTSQKLANYLTNVSVRNWQIPVISNTTTEKFVPNKLKITLAKQVISPTHFADCLKNLQKNYQPDLLIEVGPGKTLSKFANRTLPDVPVVAIGKWETYQKFLTTIK